MLSSSCTFWKDLMCTSKPSHNRHITGSFLRKCDCRSWWSNTQFLLDQMPFFRSKCAFIMLQYHGRRLSENSARSQWLSKPILSDHMCFCSIIWSVIGLINEPALPYLEVTSLETSYLSVFGLCRPIIYRPDGLFQIFADFVYGHVF